jgi:hypothetical protein
MTLPIPVPGWAGRIGFATPGLFCAKSSILRVFRGFLTALIKIAGALFSGAVTFLLNAHKIQP